MGKKRFMMTVGVIFLMIACSALAEEEVKNKIGKGLNTLSVPFVKNEGQTDREVKYYAKTFGGTLFVTEQGKLVYSLPKFEDRGKEKGKEAKVQSAVITEEFIGEEVKEVKAEGDSETKVSYFIGNDPKRHRSGIKTYDTVSLGEIYNGIELRLKAYGNNVEKLFYVRPEGKPEEIKVGIRGSKGIRVNEEGGLVVETALGEVRFTKPAAYQEIDGKRVDVAVNYCLLNSELPTPNSELIYGFKMEKYDRTKELVIDPLLQSTFLGGSSNDYGYGIAIHPTTGDVYVTGYTYSNDFPGITGGADTTFASSTEAFVSRLNSALTTLHQSTYLGGSDIDLGNGIAIHPTTGDIYVTGWTQSNDFPGIAGGADTTLPFGSEAFVSRLDSTLTTLHQSTFLGGTGADEGNGIAIHPATGEVYVAGRTWANDFPGIAGGADTTFAGSTEVFVSRLNSALTTLHQSTYLGGSNDELGGGIAIHPTTGDVYVTGDTYSNDFPGIAGGADTTFAGSSEAFVSRFNSTLTTLHQSTFLGGTGADEGNGIAIHSTTGDVYVTGDTYSNDFPGIAGGADTAFAGSPEVFVSRLNSALTTLHQSTFLGGSDIDYGYGIAIHPTIGDIYVTGYTRSNDFPGIAGGADTMYVGGEAFVSRLNSTLTTLHQSTFLGGSSFEVGRGIAIHPTPGDVYVTGDTYSNDFPGISGGAGTTFAGGEAFVSRLTSSLEKDTTTTTITSDNPDPSVVGQTVTVNFTVTVNPPGGGTPTGNVTVSDGTVNCTGTVALGTCTLTPTTAGAKTLTATYAGDVNFNGSTSAGVSHTVNKIVATITLSNLSHTYNGTPKSATATTNPLGLAVSITYNGSATPPTNVGSYAVVATINDANYQGTANGTLVIGKATATINLSNLNHIYDGTPKSATATTNPVGLSVNITYNGSATPPTNAGSYAVVATVNDPNYQGTANGTLVISKATATITLSNLSQTYDGTPKSATATTNPPGLTVISITYDGSVTPPTNAGSYAVVASLSNANYRATNATGTLVISKATATITLGNLSQTYDGTPKSATATTNPPGLTVISITYDGSTTAPTNVGNYAVVASLSNPNYQATNAIGTLVISKATATITLSNLSHTYDGTPKSATATTNPPGLTVISITYDGSATPPTNAGSYGVVASLSNANYQATNATGTLVISKAMGSISLSNLSHVYDGTPKSATANTNPPSLTVISITYDGSTTPPTNAGSYGVVASLSNANYQATNTTGTLVISKATATITLSNLSHVYDGTPKSATAATNPPGLTVEITYNGSATLPTNIGTYAVVATINDPNYQGTASGTLTISRANTTTALTSSKNPSLFSEEVTLTATVGSVVSGIGTPTGTVTFKNGSTVLGTAMLSGGTATLTTFSLPSGDCPITAEYGGDEIFDSSISAVLTQTVEPYDLILVDEFGRAELRINTLTGDWSYTILTGEGAGNTYTGTGRIVRRGEVFWFNGLDSEGWGVNLVYNETFKKGMATFGDRASGVRSSLIVTGL